MHSLVTETLEIDGWHSLDDRINPYLEAGWIILEKWKVDRGEPNQPNYHLHVLLGWVDRSRAPVHP